MAGSCCWIGRGGMGGGGVPRMPIEGNGGGGGGRGGGGGGGVLELRPAVRAGDWGLLSEKPELELEGREERRKRRSRRKKLEREKEFTATVITVNHVKTPKIKSSYMFLYYTYEARINSLYTVHVSFMDQLLRMLTLCLRLAALAFFFFSMYVTIE